MTTPKVGLQIFVHGEPVELLYRIAEAQDGQIWMVKPLFVEDMPEHRTVIHPADRCSLLHGQRV